MQQCLLLLLLSLLRDCNFLLKFSPTRFPPEGTSPSEHRGYIYGSPFFFAAPLGDDDVSDAVNVSYQDKDGDHRIKEPAQLKEVFGARGVEAGTPVVTYCQSGTRSSAVYFALYQVGFEPDSCMNYDGSWAEYSRLDLPVEP